MFDPNLSVLVESRSAQLSTDAASSLADPAADTLFPLLRNPVAASSRSYGAMGLQAEYFTDQTLTQRVLTRTDSTVDFTWGTSSPNQVVPADNFSVRWTGQVLPLYSEAYTFYTQADDRVRLWVNNQLLIDQWNFLGSQESRGTINLDAGQNYEIRLEYAENTGDAIAKLLWSSPSQTKEIIPQTQLLAPFSPADSPRSAALFSNARSINIFDSAPISDALSSTNLEDFYQFTLDESTVVNFSLSNLAANVDLKLLNERGDVISTSANDGTMMESIAAILSAGAYVLQVYAGQPVDTPYTLSSAIAQTIRERAKPADTFVDSIGIATHLRYTDTSYGRYYDIVEPRLRELGIRHIRDGGNNADMFAKMRRLGTFGIKSTLVMDPRDGITPDNVVQIIQQVQPAVAAIEGPNEWDVNAAMMTYKGKSFPDGLRDYQADLFRAVKNNPSTANIPILMASMAFPENGRYVGSLAAYSDYGNMHSYAGGNVPGQDLDWRWLPLTKNVAGNRPIMVTETGYHNAINDKRASQKGVTEQVSAKYIPRTFLEYFNRGIKRTFTYELMDQRKAGDQENNFGIIRADGTPKPAFYALRNLISLLNDTPGSSANGALSYYFTGNVKDLRHTLLQKSNGDFYLVLWLNKPSTDTPVTQRVTLNLLTPTQQAATFLPNRSSSATATFTAPTRITMDVPDAPLVIQVKPK